MKTNLNVKVFNDGGQLPKYMTECAAGMDVYAKLEENETIFVNPGYSTPISTGIYIEIPEEYEAQIRPRSGLALKHSITVANSPGTIDADYRGEIKIILINHGSETFEVKNGDRIGQMVFNKIEKVKWNEVKNKSDLSETIRNEGGFNSTGKN